MSSKKTKDIHIRLTPEDHEAARKVAELTGRTTPGLIQYALQRYLAQHYPHAYGASALQHEFERDDMAANGE